MFNNKIVYIAVCFIALFADLCIISNKSYSKVKVEKLDGVLDWEKQSNYAEAEELMKIAKDINKEKRRRKQLRDAGLSKDEISRIIKNERLAKLNNNNINIQSNSGVNSQADQYQQPVEQQSTQNQQFANQNQQIQPNNANILNNNNQIANNYQNVGDFYHNGNNFQQNVNQNTNQSNGGVAINPNYQNINQPNIVYSQNNFNGSSNNKKNNVYENANRNAVSNLSNTYANVYASANEYVDDDKKKDTQNAREVDLTIRPPIAKVRLQNDNEKPIIKDNKNNSYNDFELSRMVHKVANNLNNPEDFAIYAKEFSKIANGKRQEELSVPEMRKVVIVSIDEYDDVDEDVEYFSDNTDRFYKKTSNDGYAKNSMNSKKNSKKNKYQPNLANLYATNVEYDNYTKKNKSKKNNKQNKNGEKYLTNEEHRIFYANDDNDNENDENSDVYTMDEDEIEYEQSLVSEKQVRAKDVGVQYPVKREKNTHKTQYQPQNIAQIAYDKNNKHLQPIVFENHIVNQVFDNLGSEDAIPLARALINKVGKTDIADEDGNTLLMHAVARHNQSLIAMLLAEGANPNTLNNDGFSPLHLAASNGDNTAIYSLMMGGGNPNVRDKDGNTSLMYAAKMCNEQSIKMMMSLGGDPTIVNKSTGRTAMDFAGENDNPYVLPLLEIQTKKLRQNKNPVNLTNELT